MFDVGGASVAGADRALDGHWRNAHTLAVHNPVSYKARAVGDHEINGSEPIFTWMPGGRSRSARGAAMMQQQVAVTTLEPNPRRIRLAALEFATGRPVVVHGCGTGDGGIVLSAARVSTAWMAHAIRYSSGLVCVALPAQRCDQLELPPMAPRSEPNPGPVWCVSVDADGGISTGISAADRALAARGLASPAAVPGDFTRPGHLVPVAVGDLPAFGAPSLAEAALALPEVAGEPLAGVYAPLVSPLDPVHMADDEELLEFAASNGLPAVHAAELAAAR
nr:3,4-dihydroxy-2-butanone-4-phosphate synthase [Saccharopolyspora sp. HNM0983]